VVWRAPKQKAGQLVQAALPQRLAVGEEMFFFKTGVTTVAIKMCRF
jgi:hypothetical protein